MRLEVVRLIRMNFKSHCLKDRKTHPCAERLGQDGNNGFGTFIASVLERHGNSSRLNLYHGQRFTFAGVIVPAVKWVGTDFALIIVGEIEIRVGLILAQ